MRVAVKIVFECDMPDELTLKENIQSSIKSLVDMYRTRADITVVPKPYEFKLEGAWNG